MKRFSTKSKRVHLYFSSETYEELRKVSKELNKSLSLIVSEILLNLSKEVKND